MFKKLLRIFLLGIVILNLITPTYIKAYGKFNEEFNENFTVCIDPGHQGKGDPKGEPVAPGSSNKRQESHQEQLVLLQKKLSML